MPLRGKWVWYFGAGSAVIFGVLAIIVPTPPATGVSQVPLSPFACWFNGAWLMICGAVEGW